MRDSSDDALAVLTLLGAPGIGPSRVRAVVECFLKSRIPINEILDDKHEARRLLTTNELERIREKAPKSAPYAAKLRESGISIVPISDSRYPTILLERFGSNAPAVLFCQGAMSLLYEASIGFCGSRRASERGLEVAADCAGQLSEAGINIVSGYAAGIDLTTHGTALRRGGTTTIVLPEGIEHFRVRRDLKELWDWEKVLVVSQFYPSTPWRVENAMKRNVIICGLSKALIVVEAGRTGGSIEAGRSALAVGIPVFAPVYDGMPEAAAGNVELFGKGARKILRSKSTERAKMEALFGEVAASPPTSLFDTPRGSGFA